MTNEWTVPAWAALAVAALLVLSVGLAVTALRWCGRTTRHLAVRDAESEALRAQVAEIERRLGVSGAVVTRDQREHLPGYVVTTLGVERPRAESAPVVPPAVFADTVLRETVVQSASLLHGLRRALSPEVRNRIRFEMRREVKRSRKARRATTREALRDWQARQRTDEEPAA